MKLYNAMEESYLKENLIHKWVTNIVRQNDGYEFLLDDEVYLPVYKYALKITKRKTVKLNLVEEKVLQIVSIGVHQVDEIAKILGITRPLLDVTLADLHVKDLISVSSDICSLLKKGEQALSNLERVEKQQDIMKDIYMDSFKGKILENITRYQVVEKGIIDDNKLEPLVQAEDMKVIVSRFEDIQEIFQDEYSATRIADGIRTETQELLTIDGIESVYVVFIKIPLQVFVSTNGWDIDIVAAKKKYNELLLEYKDEIIRQINNKKVLRAHWKKKTIQESYNGECLKEVERLVETIKAADFKKKKKQKEIDELQMKILSSRRLLDGHLNKSSGSQSDYRSLGSIDIAAAVRSILFVEKVEKEKEQDIRVVYQQKDSLAKKENPVAFSLGEEGLKWLGEYDISIEDLLMGKAGTKKETKLEKAQKLILELLTKRKVMCLEELEAELLAYGISSRTGRDARKQLENRLSYDWCQGRKTVALITE